MSEIDFVRHVEKSLGSLVPDKLYALALRGAEGERFTALLEEAYNFLGGVDNAADLRQKIMVALGWATPSPSTQENENE